MRLSMCIENKHNSAGTNIDAESDERQKVGYRQTDGWIDTWMLDIVYIIVINRQTEIKE